MDGVGEWATASIAVGHGAGIRMIEEMRFPCSLGLLYSAFTQFVGFKVNSGEYKMMGLAPYGVPRYKEAILEHVVGNQRSYGPAPDRSVSPAPIPR